MNKTRHEVGDHVRINTYKDGRDDFRIGVVERVELMEEWHWRYARNRTNTKMVYYINVPGMRGPYGRFAENVWPVECVDVLGPTKRALNL